MNDSSRTGLLFGVSLTLLMSSAAIAPGVLGVSLTMLLLWTGAARIRSARLRAPLPSHHSGGWPPADSLGPSTFTIAAARAAAESPETRGIGGHRA